MSKQSFLFLAVAFLTVTLAGCNTLKGAGKDVENTGKNIQETVQHND